MPDQEPVLVRSSSNPLNSSTASLAPSSSTTHERTTIVLDPRAEEVGTPDESHPSTAPDPPEAATMVAYAKEAEEPAAEITATPHAPGSRIGNIYRIGSKSRQIRTVPSAHPLVDLDGDPEAAGDDTTHAGGPRPHVPVTWHDFARVCCCHSAQEWSSLAQWVVALLGLLYLFLVGLDLLGTAFQVLGGCSAGSLLGQDVRNWTVHRMLCVFSVPSHSYVSLHPIQYRRIPWHPSSLAFW
jgi:hypothetical protein